jgi:hypothetical protein
MPNHVRKFRAEVKAPRRRQCWVCGKTKRIENFNRGSKGLLGRRRDCKDCHNAQARKRHLMKNIHGISIESNNEMVEKQGRVCAICRQPERYISARGHLRILCIDHDHATGLIRELLCNRCNRIIGYAKDNSEILEAASSYIKRHRREIPRNVIEMPIQNEEAQ